MFRMKKAKTKLILHFLGFDNKVFAFQVIAFVCKIIVLLIWRFSVENICILNYLLCNYPPKCLFKCKQNIF